MHLLLWEESMLAGNRSLASLVAFLVALTLTTQLQATRQRWVNIGPEQIFAWDLVEDPVNPNNLYIAAGTAGVYRSTDAGGSWRLANSGLRDGYCRHLAVDPLTPQVVYATVSIPGLPGWTLDYGSLNRSENNAVTWSEARSAWGTVFHLSVDPHAAGRLYLSVSRPSNVIVVGEDNRPYLLFVSNDAGKNWRSVTYSATPAALYTFPHPRVAGLVLGIERTEARDTVLKSVDYGESWARVTQLDTVASKLEFDAHDEKRIYAATAKGLLISTDGGATWLAAANGLSAAAVRSLDVLGDGSLLVWQDRVYKSTDHGQSWQAAAAVDSQARQFIPSRSRPGVFYVLTHESVLKSTNAGQNWETANRGLTSYSVDRLAIAPSDPDTVYLLISPLVIDVHSPSSRNFVSRDGGRSWTKQTWPPGHVLAIHPEDANRVYLGSSQGVWLSTDGAQTWRMTRTGDGEDETLATLLVDPAHPNWVYASYNSGLERSEDGGETWHRINSELKASRLVLHSASRALYAANLSGLWISRDDGASWQLLREGWSFSLALDSAANPTIYLQVYSGPGLVKSVDGGKTWISSDFGLTSGGPVQITSEGTLYVASRGVLRSDDGGASWHPANSGLASGGYRLIADPKDPDVLYLGSSVHGLYRLESTRGTRLVFPALTETDSTLTGFAVANPQAGAAELQFIARKADGQLVDVEKNPRVKLLGGFRQLALTGRELFPADPTIPLQGWVELNSPSDHLTGFFMSLAPDQADGAQAAKFTSNQLCFSRIHQGPEGFLGQEAVTSLYIVNPNNEAVTVSLYLRRDDGSQPSYSGGSRVIAPNGVLSGTVSELFGVSSLSGGYVVADVAYSDPQSLGGITGFEVVELPKAKTRFALPAADSVFLTEGYSAQVSSVSGAQTRIKLVNLAEENRKVRLQVYGETGGALSPEIEVELGPRVALDKAASDLFSIPASQAAVGSLRVIADGGGVLGDVVFGDFDGFKRMAALRIENKGLEEAIFGQVANGLGYYTGLALFNPSDQPAEVTLEVYSAEGQQTGQSVVHLPPFGRISKLLVELIPTTDGQVRGWIRLRSSRPIAAQELFGTDELLAAVPAANDE